MLLCIFLFLLPLSEALTDKIQQKNISEDGRLNFTQLANKYGHQCEEFDVHTDDGYILKLFHITGNETKTPVLLMHGILDSADTFIIRGKISIAINLAEAGYDVWAGNVRGNKYSRNHIKLSPDKDRKEFWDFSFHEMGVHDLPAIIDFILERTGQGKLSAIGHSQGNSIFYILGSEKPEYNQKISLQISLAPIAYLRDIGFGLASLIKLWSVIDPFFKSLGHEGVLQDESALKELVQFICSRGHLSELCVAGVGAVVGDDTEELEPEFFDVGLAHFPAGASRKTFAHFEQIAKSGSFSQYDYGLVRNRLVYKSATPPVYNLTKSTMPTVLLVGKNDGIAGIRDVKRLKSELSNVVHYSVMEREKFNHIDYIWGKNLDIYMTPLLRELLLKYT